MKILFVVDNYSGGAGNIAQLLATEYAKTEDVSVLLTHKTIEKRYECPGVKFVELNAADKPSGVRAVPYQIKWLKQRIKEEKPDVIISFITLNSVLVDLARPGNKTPIVACERTNPLVYHLNFPWNWLTRKAYDRAELITIQFDLFREMHGGRYKEKCRVTPNYIATPDRVKDIERKGEITKFVSCGRLMEAKQFEMLLEMFAQIHKKNPKTELKIYGKGEQETVLQEKIRELGLEDCACLAGYATDTYGVLCEADVYLMSSKREGFPNALSEAMAVGLPSVSFRCHGGIDELLDNGRRGVAVPLNDQQAFVEACLELCHNKEKCIEYSENAKEVCRIYSLENVKKIWDSCIEEAIQRSK